MTNKESNSIKVQSYYIYWFGNGLLLGGDFVIYLILKI